MPGMNAKWKIPAICLMIAALVFLFRLGKPPTSRQVAGKDRIRAVESRLGGDEIAAEEGGGIRKPLKRENENPVQSRSKGALLNEVQLVFGQAEAARARKLEERFHDGKGIYLYVVEQPSKGEVQTVKAQIADLRKEVAPEDREYFDKQLEGAIASYDPYGEMERKVFMITVPVDKAQRMSGMIVEAGDLEEFRRKFVSGESHTVKMRQGFFASYDGKTLERFDQVMVWEPDKKE